MAVEPDPRASRLLRDLLLKLTLEEARVLLADIGGRHLIQQINWNGSAESITFSIVETLENRRLIDEVFLAELHSRLKRWTLEIETLERLYRVGPVQRKIALLHALHHCLVNTEDVARAITLIMGNFDIIFPAREDTYQQTTATLIEANPSAGFICFHVARTALLGTRPTKTTAPDPSLTGKELAFWIFFPASTPLLKQSGAATTLSDELLEAAQKLATRTRAIVRPNDQASFHVFAGSRRTLTAAGQTAAWVRAKNQHPFRSLQFQTTESLLERICAALMRSHTMLPVEHPVRMLFSGEHSANR